MLRLAHRITTESRFGYFPRLADATSVNMAQMAVDAVGLATTVVADNVADFVHSATMNGDGSTKVKDSGDLFRLMPTIAPPCPLMFIEWIDTHSPSGSEQEGVLVMQQDSCKLAKVLWQAVKPSRPLAADESWFVTVPFRFVGRICPHVQFPCVLGLFVHDLLGGFRAIGGQFPPEILTTFDPACDSVDLLAGVYASSILPALGAISFMHCKNVEVVDATEEEGPTKKWLRRQKAPAIRYHVLNIEPMKKVLRTEGNLEETGLKKALHICRGHFSTYSEEKPLFGKYAGRFWIPSHVRGSSEHGTVVKDYEVKL